MRLENGLATPLERLDAELAMTTARAQLARMNAGLSQSLALNEIVTSELKKSAPDAASRGSDEPPGAGRNR